MAGVFALSKQKTICQERKISELKTKEIRELYLPEKRSVALLPYLPKPYKR